MRDVNQKIGQPSTRENPATGLFGTSGSGTMKPNFIPADVLPVRQPKPPLKGKRKKTVKSRF